MRCTERGRRRRRLERRDAGRLALRLDVRRLELDGGAERGQSSSKPTRQDGGISGAYRDDDIGAAPGKAGGYG
jgi:hypothetical protein